MKKLQPQIGDKIKVELSDGKEFIGTYDIHPLAGECVKNQYNFPINYKRIIEIIE